MALQEWGSRLVAVLALLASGAAWSDGGAEKTLQTVCGACHASEPGGGYARISEIRKTPEGWAMTIDRMRQAHGVTLSDDDEAALVEYLADKQGLAPTESAPYRAFLEHRPDAKDVVPNQLLAETCARCHSFARIGLQRRDTAEWVKHANFHLGQYPTAEYQEKGRDREWWKIASEEVPPLLGKMLPFTTPDWTAWQAHKPVDIGGTWRIVGHTPGVGDYQGHMVLKPTAAGHYDAMLDVTYRNGPVMKGDGSVILYTGHEWRGEFTVGKETIRQVLDVAADGSVSGRWFYADRDEQGGDLKGLRAQAGATQITQVSPSYIRAGETAEIEIDGAALAGDAALGDGVKIDKVVSHDGDRVVVQATAAKDAAEGARPVAVGNAKLVGALVVYRKIATVKVVPDDAIARVGGNGGPIPPVPAQFEAVGYLASPDGDPAKAVRIGVFPAKWSVQGYDEIAKALRDIDFAGKISPTGEFEPAGAGPNPQRKFGTNNAGNLTVTGTVSDGGATLSGHAHLIVTVQRWVKPDIL